jgi:hypothetical protein
MCFGACFGTPRVILKLPLILKGFSSAYTLSQHGFAPLRPVRFAMMPAASVSSCLDTMHQHKRLKLAVEPGDLDALSLENLDAIPGGAVHAAAMGVSIGATASSQK